VAAKDLQTQQQREPACRTAASSAEHLQGQTDDPGQIHGGHQLGTMAVNRPGGDLGQHQPDGGAEKARGPGQIPAAQHPDHAQPAKEQVDQHPGLQGKAQIVLEA